MRKDGLGFLTRLARDIRGNTLAIVARRWCRSPR